MDASLNLKDRIVQSTQNVLNGKNNIREAIIKKGVEVAEIPTFQQLQEGVDKISTEKPIKLTNFLTKKISEFSTSKIFEQTYNTISLNGIAVDSEGRILFLRKEGNSESDSVTTIYLVNEKTNTISNYNSLPYGGGEVYNFQKYNDNDFVFCTNGGNVTHFYNSKNNTYSTDRNSLFRSYFGILNDNNTLIFARWNSYEAGSTNYDLVKGDISLRTTTILQSKAFVVYGSVTIRAKGMSFDFSQNKFLLIASASDKVISFGIYLLDISVTTNITVSKFINQSYFLDRPITTLYSNNDYYKVLNSQNIGGGFYLSEILEKENKIVQDKIFENGGNCSYCISFGYYKDNFYFVLYKNSSPTTYSIFKTITVKTYLLSLKNCIYNIDVDIEMQGIRYIANQDFLCDGTPLLVINNEYFVNGSIKSIESN